MHVKYLMITIAAATVTACGAGRFRLPVIPGLATDDPDPGSHADAHTDTEPGTTECGRGSGSARPIPTVPSTAWYSTMAATISSIRQPGSRGRSAASSRQRHGQGRQLCFRRWPRLQPGGEHLDRTQPVEQLPGAEDARRHGHLRRGGRPHGDADNGLQFHVRGEAGTLRLAGQYSVQIGVLGTVGTATLAVGSDGSLVGSSASISTSTSNSCGISGTLAPRDRGNAYDATIVFDANCAYPTQTTKGAAYFDASSKRLYVVTVNNERTRAAAIVGTRP